MKISIEATAQEIAELLRAITSNQEQNLNLSIDGGRVFPHKNQSVLKKSLLIGTSTKMTTKTKMDRD